MGEAPQVSVIIPAYNYAQFLPFAIQSALMQASDDLAVEVIVIDDGSTDETPDVIAAFGSQIRAVRKINQGLSAARNTGMALARGSWFVFLDADDVLLPGVLASQKRVLEATGADIAICCSEEARSLTPGGPFWNVNVWRLMRDSIPVHLCLHNVAPSHAYMLRKACVQTVGDFDTSLRACEDHDFWLRCAVNGARFAVNSEGLVLYRKHAISMSAQKSNQLAHDALLHDRVRQALTEKPGFVGDDLQEAWLAHAAGCLRTTVGLLSNVASQREQQTALNLLERATEALKIVGGLYLSRGQHDAASVNARYYVLYMKSFLHVLEPLGLDMVSQLCTMVERILTRWKVPPKNQATLRTEVWDQLVVPQELHDLNALSQPVVASVSERMAPRLCVEAFPRRSILLGSDFFHPSTGGCELFMLDLGRQLLKAGYDVTVVTRHLDERVALHHDGLRILSFRCHGRLCDRAFGEQFAEYAQFLRSVPFQARVFLSQPDAWLTAPLLTGPLPGQTFVLPVINPELLEGWQATRSLDMVAEVLRNATSCLALTESGLDQRFLKALDLQPVFLPHAIHEYPPNPGFRQRHGLGQGPLLVHVANFWPVKNHHSLLQALKGVPGDWTLALIGNALPWPAERAYHDQAMALAAEDPRVVCCGGLPPEEADAAIAEADLLLLPSHAECRPLVILQAMRHGTPWIATPECNSVQDDAGGFICPVESFGTVIRACLKHPTALQVLGQVGREHWQRIFCWEHIMPVFSQLFETGGCETSLAMPKGLRVANSRLQRKILEG